MIRAIAPIFLLLISNIFMTFAWYGHLKFKSSALWAVVLVSWGIAFFEYCFQVPANRIGYSTYNAAQLKTIQEVITLVVFSFFSVFYLKEQFKWNYLVGFALIVLAVFFIFKKWWLWVKSEKFFTGLTIVNCIIVLKSTIHHSQLTIHLYSLLISWI